MALTCVQRKVLRMLKDGWEIVFLEDLRPTRGARRSAVVHPSDSRIGRLAPRRVALRTLESLERLGLVARSKLSIPGQPGLVHWSLRNETIPTARLERQAPALADACIAARCCLSHHWHDRHMASRVIKLIEDVLKRAGVSLTD